MRDIDNTQDILDSRDVIARRDELAEERADLKSEADDYTNVVRDEAIEALRAWDAENAEELAALEAFIAEGSDDWADGVALVRETYFRDYAQELAEDIGDIDFRKLQWPLTCIDWDQAARELQYDYTGADFAGVTYYYQG